MATEYDAGFIARAQWALDKVGSLPGISLSQQHEAALSAEVIQEHLSQKAEPEEATPEPQTLAEAMGMGEATNEPVAVAEVETTESSDGAQVEATAAETATETPAEEPAEAIEADAATAPAAEEPAAEEPETAEATA